MAGAHSHDMARARQLRHNDAYFTDENRQRLDARTLGENVAVGASSGEIHRALMASEPHRANVLDPRFTVIGIGAVQNERGWWVTQDFVQPRR